MTRTSIAIDSCVTVAIVEAVCRDADLPARYLAYDVRDAVSDVLEPLLLLDCVHEVRDAD